MRGLFLCLVVGLVVSSCAARTMTPKEFALAAFDMSDGVYQAEQQLYAAGLYTEEKHRMLADVVLRLLVAARGFDQAVNGVTDQPVGNARQNFALAVDDLEVVVAGIPRLEAAVKALRALMGS